MNNEAKMGIVAGIILVFTMMIGGVLWLGNKKHPTLVQTKLVQNKTPIADKNVSNILPSMNIPIIMHDNEFDWHDPISIKPPDFFNKGNDSKLVIKAWEVGVQKSSGQKVILVTTNSNEMGGANMYVFVSEQNGDGIIWRPYSKYSSGNFLINFDPDKMSDQVATTDGYDRIISLEYPGFLQFNNVVFKQEDDKLYNLNTENPFFQPSEADGYWKIYTDKIYGDVFENKNDGGIYLKSPIGLARIYSLKMDFFSGDIPQVNWNDGAKTQDPFTYKGVSGCGGQAYADDASKDVSMDSLLPTGKTNTGEVVYEYKDKNADYLKKWYQEDVDFVKNTGDDNIAFKKNTAYDSFAANHLVFFWKDPLGRLIRFVNTSYVYGGGCGKPVIYLYPQQTENISVKVMPTGGMTVSDPAYGQGWNVTVDPNSNITNLIDGKAYPYLFWEGRGDSIYQMPKNGFMTTRENLESLLNDKLAQLGLNQKETADFKEFWLPKMLSENKPYYFVTFVPRQEIDNIAPLNINPRPDTIIRVLMDYRGLDNSIDVSGFNIKTPKRNGFTAVEWGGVLR